MPPCAGPDVASLGSRLGDGTKKLQVRSGECQIKQEDKGQDTTRHTCTCTASKHVGMGGWGLSAWVGGARVYSMM